MTTIGYQFGEDWLSRLHVQPAAPAENAIIDLGLRFANSMNPTYRDWFAIQGIAGNRGRPPTGNSATYGDWLADEKVAADLGIALRDEGGDAKLRHAIHRAYRDALSAIVRGTASQKIQDEWISAKNDVLRIGTTRRVGGQLREEVRYRQLFARTALDGMLAVTLVWLLARGPGKVKGTREGQLCQCHWSECQLFFLTEPPKAHGSWRTRYCLSPGDDRGQDHMKKADDQRKRERKRARPQSTNRSSR